MRGIVPALAVVLALAATPVAARRAAQAGFAEPADIIAAEGNFTHLIAAKGIMAAIRATAAPDAQIFASRLMRVTEYVHSADPNLLPQGHTRQLWMSCDGSIAVTHGEWQRLPVLGWYATIWQRQKGGNYKWVLAQWGTRMAALPESDMINASIADCPVRRTGASASAGKTEASEHKASLPDYLSGHSDDATLEWTTAPGADGSRSFVLRFKRDAAMREVLRAIAAPPGA